MGVKPRNEVLGEGEEPLGVGNRYNRDDGESQTVTSPAVLLPRLRSCFLFQAAPAPHPHPCVSPWVAPSVPEINVSEPKSSLNGGY